MKISIIVPIYNSERYLEKCIDSLIIQSFHDIEIILINDGSCDNSLSICQGYKNDDNRIIIIDKQNGGLSDARNAGLAVAEGDYVLFVDSDDYIVPDTCQHFYNIISKYAADIITGNARRIDNDNIVFIKHSLTDIENHISGKEFLKHELKNDTMNMAAWLNLYNTDFLRKNNLQFKKGIYHEDELFTPQAFLKAENVISSDIVFYNYIIRENSITTKKDQTKNTEDVLETCQTLEKIYSILEDRLLATYLNDHLVNLYLNKFQVAKLYKRKYKYLIDKKLLKYKGYSKINKIRIVLFRISPTIYYFINQVRKQFVK